MKQSFFVLILICLATCILHSCKTDNRQITSDLIHFPPSSGEGTDGESPEITFDSLTFDFGKIAIGQSITHIFTFKNTGKSPLIISQVNPSCGCTTSKDWPHEPIAPGEDGQITIEFNSKGFPGKIDKSIAVVTNCIPKVINLKLTGEVMGTEVKTDVKPPIEMEMK